MEVEENKVTSEALAHVTEDGRPHLLIEHLQEVSILAEEFAKAFGAGNAARLAGLWHDIGKYAGPFQDMIRRANGFASHIEPEDAIGPRDHSTAGAVLASNMPNNEGMAIAFAIAGHHAGLSDSTKLKSRLRNKAELLESARAGGMPDSIQPQETGDLMPGFLLTKGEPKRTKRRFEMWIRMLFSTLVDADFLDTEEFYQPKRTDLRGGHPGVGELHSRLEDYLDRLESGAPDTKVNRVRRKVRVACTKAASENPAVFSLTAPTGAGKTLAAMVFGLAHAQKHGLRRVVVAVPFTSIIEQNARVYRDAVGADVVLEHHSSLDPLTETPENRIACENWDAPIVVTTTVQLLNSLFAARTSQCRKLHRLAHSVIVLDEVQSLPPHLIECIVDGLSSLQEDFGATIVLSTATQPALGKDIVSAGFSDIVDILPSELELFQDLKRVRVEWPDFDAPVTEYDELADLVASQPSALCIVHRRRDARELCQMLDTKLGDTTTMHLSALMCAFHRSEVLDTIKSSQRSGSPLRCISTQLVEAGVDLDFPVVFRALAGLDALAQAAGRCNREGKQIELGRLIVFRAPTKPPHGVLATAHDVASGMIKTNPELDLFAPETQRAFFGQLYGLLPKDRDNIQDKRERLLFKEVASLFQLIEDDWSASLVIPYADGAKRIAELEKYGPSRGRLRALQPFTINVSKRDLDLWMAKGFCYTIEDTVVVLDSVWMSAYDERFGLIP